MVDTGRRATAIGVFEDRPTAERAIDRLRQAGFTSERIGFVWQDPDAEGVREEGAQAGEGAATGAITGGVIGGLLGAAAALLIPGVGPVVAGGILAASLGGAALGATAGGLVGALVGMGVPEEEARYYQGEFESGRVLVTVEAGDRYDEANEILRTHGGYRYGSHGDTSRTFGRREPYDRHTEPSTALAADTSHRPATSTSSGNFTPSGVGSSAPSTLGTTGNTNLNMSTSNVEAHVPTNRPGVSQIGERGTSPGGALVSGDDEIVGARDMRDDTSRDVPTWESARGEFQRDWERQQGSTGRRWQDAEPAWHYGHEMAHDQRYRGRDWDEVETDLRGGYADWARSRGYQHGDDTGGWENMRQDIYDAWSRSRAGRYYGDPGGDMERRPLS